jgi:IclR family pca regulon transcriptional regulator
MSSSKKAKRIAIKGKKMNKHADMEAQRPKSSLARGLLVLESFTREKENYSLAELTATLGIPNSSLFRVVKELSQLNYLRYQETSKRYYLGTRVMSLGFALLASMELREIARPYMEKLSRECNKSVNLAVFDRNAMVYVERIRVPGIREFNISIGAKLPLWNTAVGKAVLAHVDQQRIDELQKQSYSLGDLRLDKTGLRNELANVRREGFALNNQEFIRGILAVAVPVFSSEGVVGAINIAAEPEDVTIETLRKEYAPKLISVGRELSRTLGCHSRTSSC